MLKKNKQNLTICSFRWMLSEIPETRWKKGGCECGETDNSGKSDTFALSIAEPCLYS